MAGIVGPGSNVVTELMAYVVGASTQAVMVSEEFNSVNVSVM